MINCLLLYSHDSGHHDFTKYIDKVNKALSMSFDHIDMVCTKSAFESFQMEREAIGKYHSLIVVGGDGSFNTAVNALACQKDAPILGYINEGTLGDVGRNFGVDTKLSKSLKVISEGHYREFDIGEAGGRYFSYMAALGQYANIAYSVPRHVKKRLGKYSYYLKAANEAVRKSEPIEVKISYDGQYIEGAFPFILILNGINVGGLRINRRGSLDDGKMEAFLTEPGLFGGLLHYFSRRGLTRFSFSKMELTPLGDYGPWCLDGEMGPSGKLSIVCHHKALKVYCKN